MGTQGVNLYKQLQTKPQLSGPTPKEQENFDNLIDFKKQEIKFDNTTIQYTLIELYDANNDGVFTDGEHLKVTTKNGEVIFLHNFKNREDFEATKNNYLTKYNSKYQNSTNTKRPMSYDFLMFTQNKKVTPEEPISAKTSQPTLKTITAESEIKISRRHPLSSYLHYPNELNKNTHFLNFKTGLITHRKEIQEITKLTDAEYIKLSQIALAIIKAETDSGNNKNEYMRLRRIGNAMRNKFVKKEERKQCSQGISNIKVEDDTHLYEQYKKLGITIDCPSNIHTDDSLAAAATIIKLNDFLKKGYPTYTKNSIQYGVLPERILTETEYLFARWKGIPVLEKEKDGTEIKVAKDNTTLIINFRNNPQQTVDPDSVRMFLKIHNQYMKK